MMHRISSSQAMVVAICVVCLMSLGTLIFAMSSLTAQSERMRHAFCDIVQPYAADPSIPQTSGGEKLKESFREASSGDGLGCTPDPNDGK